MKTKFFTIGTICLFVLGIFIYSCETVELSKPDINSETAIDAAKAEDALADAFGAVNGASTSSLLKTNNCYTITPVTGGFDINFSGCTTKSGIIHAFVNNYNAVGGTVRIVFDNYTSGGCQYVGELNGTRKDTVINGVTYPMFTLIGQNITINLPESKTITITNYRKAFVWKEGFETPNTNTENDVFLIFGKTTGIDRNSSSFEINTNDLLIKNSCDYPVSGTISLTQSVTSTINFGNGDCDNSASYTLNGVTININL